MRFQPSSRERLRNLLTLFNAAKMLILGKFNPVSSSKISFPVMEDMARANTIKQNTVHRGAYE